MPSPQRPALIALLALLCSLAPKYPAPAQNRQKEPSAQAPAIQKPLPQEKEPDYSQEAVVIEKFKTTYRFEKDGTGRREMNLRVKIQSDVGAISVVVSAHNVSAPTGIALIT